MSNREVLNVIEDAASRLRGLAFLLENQDIRLSEETHALIGIGELVGDQGRRLERLRKRIDQIEMSERSN